MIKDKNFKEKVWFLFELNNVAYLRNIMYHLFMRLDQKLYSLTNFNFHLQNINKELNSLKNFLIKNKVNARSMIDIGCADGYVTSKIAKYFPLGAISYNIRTKEEIIDALQKTGYKIIDDRTNLYANYWHDRSFILARI